MCELTPLHRCHGEDVQENLQPVSSLKLQRFLPTQKSEAQKSQTGTGRRAEHHTPSESGPFSLKICPPSSLDQGGKATVLRAEVNAAEARSQPAHAAALAWWRTTSKIQLTQREQVSEASAPPPGPRKTELNQSGRRGKRCGKTYGQPRAGAGGRGAQISPPVEAQVLRVAAAGRP